MKEAALSVNQCCEDIERETAMQVYAVNPKTKKNKTRKFYFFSLLIRYERKDKKRIKSSSSQNDLTEMLR